jgi:class 3 adenylate cyclase
MHCGHPVIATTPIDDSRFTRIAEAAPDALVQKVRSAMGLTGERRLVTILFVDVVGSTALSEQLDMSTWTGILNDVIDLLTPVIFRYEGTIARMLGDSLLAFFGAPVAHEDDPVRAVRAALEIQDLGKNFSERLRQNYDIEFALRACIHTGSVVLNAVQDDMKLDFTSIDGAVDVPSRIKFTVKPREVVVTDTTYQLVHPLYNVSLLEPVRVKGLEEPIGVYRVEGMKGQPGPVRGIQGLESPMVGRDRELRTLLDLCETVRAGLGRVVTVIGDPGLGKTRLVTEWKTSVTAERLQNPPRWVEGRSLSYGQGLAYHMLINVLRSLFNISDALDESQARAVVAEWTQELFNDEMMEVYPYIGNLLSIPLEDEALKVVNLPDPQTLQNQYYQAVHRLLMALSAEKPLVIVLEDLHWADPSSVDLFVRLLNVTTTSSILICLVTREERDAPGWRLVNAARELMGSSLRELTLAPLTESDSRKMVANLLKMEALPERIRKIILKKAEGNPLFVEEIIRMLIDRGVIISDGEGWVASKMVDEVDIPDNLQGLLTARIDRLPEDAKMVLRVASVIGRQFPVQVLEQILQEYNL